MDSRLIRTLLVPAILLVNVEAALLGAENQALRQTAETAFAKPPFHRTHWGVLIESEEGETLYAHDADALMTPASSRKLFTAAFVENCLGLGRRLRTEVALAGVVRDGVLRGDLVIRGDGDPSFGGRFDPTRQVALGPIVEALRARGVRRIAGDIVADVSLFGDDILPPDWKHGYLSDYYAAPVDALAFNENVVGIATIEEGCKVTSATPDPSFVRVRVDRDCDLRRAVRYRADASNDVTVTARLVRDAPRARVTELVSVGNPARFTAQALRDELQRNGIASRGVRLSRESVKTIEPLVAIDAPPISTLLGVVLEDSQNLYAESLLKRAAASTKPAPVRLEDALAAEQNFHRNVLGLDAGSFSFYDGSGLAPDNLVSPRALVKVMRYLSAPERRGALLPLMAEPGDPGTLRNRLKPLKGRLYAKTGYINGVAALAGTLVRRDGRHVYFAIVANHYDVPSSQIREVIDLIVNEMASAY